MSSSTTQQYAVSSWNDDERAIEYLHTRWNAKPEDDCVPLHIILRNALWEERDRMFTSNYNNSNKSREPSPKRMRFTYDDDLISNEDAYSSDEYLESSEYVSSDDEGKLVESACHDTHANETDTHMEKIIDNQIYRRFGYV